MCTLWIRPMRRSDDEPTRPHVARSSCDSPALWLGHKDTAPHTPNHQAVLHSLSTEERLCGSPINKYITISQGNAIKTTMRDHFTPIRMAITRRKQQKITRVERMWRKRPLPHCLGGCMCPAPARPACLLPGGRSLSTSALWRHLLLFVKQPESCCCFFFF